MLTRKADAQMDFDFAKVVEASKDNPVWYVQYAHARTKRLHRKATEFGIECTSVDLSRLDTIDLALVKLAAQFPRVVETSAVVREPHRIAFYLYDLASSFHSAYNLGNDIPERRFVIEGNPELTCARLFLTDAIGQVVRNGLAIMGVEAVQEM
jgi:arginyl-tRNA synthetase